MENNYSFYIVDDDPILIQLLAKLLESKGHRVMHNSSSVAALAEILENKPDCVILDIMMPGLDGFEICKRLRKESGFDKVKIVFVSGKPYDFDRNQAFSFGADGYFIKPIDVKTFPDQILRIINDNIDLAFWGVRGTLPVPGAGSIKYGGNTSCVTLKFPKGEFFIFDAGTGIKCLSDHLLKSKVGKIDGKIFISHPHWDHINALQFFVPFYIQGNEFQVCGPAHGDLTMREIISSQMEGVHFPIKIKEFAARVYFSDLKEESFDVGSIVVKTMLLNHPGNCLGYRIEYKDRIFCYITDNELYPEDSRFYNKTYLTKLINFIQGANALVTDCTYTDEEYKSKVSYGHSSVTQVAELAHKANVEALYLFHHDPDQSDQDIEKKWEMTRQVLKDLGSKTICIAPMEQQTFIV